jgi:hypothetical protein
MPRFVTLIHANQPFCISADHVAQICGHRVDKGTRIQLTTAGSIVISMPIAQVIAETTRAESANKLVAYQDPDGNVGYVGVCHIRAVNRDRNGNATLEYVYLGDAEVTVKTSVPFEEMIRRLNAV